MNRQQIWDYVGDAYVHRLNQSKVDGKLITDINSHCMALEGDCDSCECSEDSGISGALYSSKVETVCASFEKNSSELIDIYILIFKFTKVIDLNQHLSDLVLLVKALHVLVSL